MTARREQDFHWEGVDRGELLAQKCGACGTLRHPPVPRCAVCGSMTWDAQRLSGRGTILSWVRLRHPSGEGDTRTGIVVETDEGIRLVSNLIDQENAAIGAPVTVAFGTVGDDRLALFRTTAA